MTIGEKSLRLHRHLRGKIAVSPKAKIESFGDLSVYYTPGVGAVSSYLARHKEKMRKFTIKGNTVAIVSDGSAVLGLGNLGPEGAIPVMEGKAMIFKEFVTGIFSNIIIHPLKISILHPINLDDYFIITFRSNENITFFTYKKRSV